MKKLALAILLLFSTPSFAEYPPMTKVAEEKLICVELKNNAFEKIAKHALKNQGDLFMLNNIDKEAINLSANFYQAFCKPYWDVVK